MTDPINDPINEAIQILTAEAASIRECHTHPTSRDDWTGEEKAKADYDRMTRCAAELSKVRALVVDERELRAAAQAFYNASEAVVRCAVESLDDRDTLVAASARLRAALAAQPTIKE